MTISQNQGINAGGDKPEISIIVPCYNGSKFIPDCIRSIRAQSFGDYEVLVINDGSTDDSQEVFLRETVGDKRFRMLTKKNEGAVTARFHGMDRMQGNYFTFCDIDDRLRPDALEKLLTAASDSGADAAVATFNMVTGRKSRKWNIKSRRWLPGFEYTRQLMSNRYPWQTWAKLFHRDLYSRETVTLPKDVQIGEDAALTIQLFLQANRITVINEAVYDYIQQPGSMMNSGKYRYEDYFRCAEFIEKKLAGSTVYDNMKDYIASFGLLSLSSASRAFGVKDCCRNAGEAVRKYARPQALRNIPLAKRLYIRYLIGRTARLATPAGGAPMAS